MNFYVIIPAHNEEAFLAQTLQSLVEQTVLPKKIVVVNDNSTDGTQQVLDSFTEKYDFISSVFKSSAAKNTPGKKVIEAFSKGFESLDDAFDVVCKFDADLIFPKHYLESIQQIFEANPHCGMAGGFCYVEKNDSWKLENLTNKDHIRGALKAYRKECFVQINGLRNAMGWDTVDELLAKYHGWEVKTDTYLHVKHLKPTGASYSKASKYKQGEAFYTMRYGFLLTAIASAKLAFRKKSISFFLHSLQGYRKALQQNKEFIVSEEEGKFIRTLRWNAIKKKLFLKS
ncbi:glycosyltransferase involved in cell wall biosynthesis [Ulvibacter sp. MAR_2010_11]|uniref:glycosyltransferase family 2 protein n=1 Tax=Ulvibacter sp. MAR_2010_11 TaxID=1250229 RepID=UPI000C2CBC84|nr:glycosyltransferase family 2 protein [Ulvibacter sp. MAR_2010_11]PKA83434.1 glycosyltransferase involved in cell wall biosynthesis [Ulvibacter sp. MAR_2010_11]